MSRIQQLLTLAQEELETADLLWKTIDTELVFLALTM